MRKLTVLFMTAVFTLAFLACDNSTSPPDMNRDPTLIHPPASISIGYDAHVVSLRFPSTPNTAITDVNQYRIYIRHNTFGQTHLTSQGIREFRWLSHLDTFDVEIRFDCKLRLKRSTSPAK